MRTTDLTPNAVAHRAMVPTSPPPHPAMLCTMKPPLGGVSCFDGPLGDIHSAWQPLADGEAEGLDGVCSCPLI